MSRDHYLRPRNIQDNLFYTAVALIVKLVIIYIKLQHTCINSLIGLLFLDNSTQMPELLSKLAQQNLNAQLRLSPSNCASRLGSDWAQGEFTTHRD